MLHYSPRKTPSLFSAALRLSLRPDRANLLFEWVNPVKKMRMKRLIMAALMGAAVGLAPPKANATIQASLAEFTGDDSTLNVTIEEQDGGLLFTLETPSEGAITGFWADLPSNPSMADWEATGGNIEDQSFSGNVGNLGNGVNLNGGGSPGPLDFGIRFAGGKDGQSSISFLLTGSGLSESLFTGATYGARLQSLSGPEGSAKLVGPANGPTPGTPVPDSSTTVALLGLSLVGIEGLRRRLVKTQPAA